MTLAWTHVPESLALQEPGQEIKCVSRILPAHRRSTAETWLAQQIFAVERHQVDSGALTTLLRKAVSPFHAGHGDAYRSYWQHMSQF